MLFLKEEFLIAPIGEAAPHVAFICKHFYAFIKELYLECYLSNQDDNNTYFY